MMGLSRRMMGLSRRMMGLRRWNYRHRHKRREEGGGRNSRMDERRDATAWPGADMADRAACPDRQGRDPVTQVLAAMRAFRPARLIRRFRHGSGGTSLVALEGQRVVLKAWPAWS